MDDATFCKTCDRGRLELRTFPRHGELAEVFGIVLVLVSVLSFAASVVGLGFTLLSHDPDAVIAAIWMIASLLVGAVGALVRAQRTVLVCSCCGAATEAVRQPPSIAPSTAEARRLEAP